MRGKCDLCVAVTVHTVPVSIGDSPKRTLDLCQDHHDQLLVPVIEALAQYGAIAKKVKAGERVPWSRASWMRKVGPFKCRMPGCVAPVLKDGEVFDRHLRNLHDGLRFVEYAKTYGSDEATAEERAAPVTIECPEFECDTVYSTLFGNRWPHHAMTSHMRGRHGLIWRPGGIGVVGKVADG